MFLLNQRTRCRGSEGLDEATVTAVMNDWRTAPVNERVRAALGFLEKHAVPEGEVTAADITTLRTAGLSDQAIREVMYVCFNFNILTRLADALDFDTPNSFEKEGDELFKRGYLSSSLSG